MRKAGTRFVGVDRFRDFRDILTAFLGADRVSEEESQILCGLIHNHKVAELLVEEDFESVIPKVLKPAYCDKYRHKFPQWKDIVTRQHRNLVRLNGFNELLGFRVGQTIGQQYFESAEFLDVTKSPEVAAFFATREGSKFVPVSSTASSNCPANIGVIYRFDVGSSVQDGTQAFDYYSAPPYIDAEAIIASIEGPADSPASWRPRDYVVNYLATDGHRDWLCLQAPKGTISTTRIGRQRAGFLIPDELHSETRDGAGNQSVSFQAVEDLNHRPGTEKFFFMHDETASRQIAIEATDLWPFPSPGEETLCELASCVIFSWQIYQCRLEQEHPMAVNLVYQEPARWIPPRPDLATFIF